MGWNEDVLAALADIADGITVEAQIDPEGLALEATLGALCTKAATETTLAALKNRGDLLATEATLGALKSRGDLLGTEITLSALNAQAGLLATEATLDGYVDEFEDFALDDALDSPLYGFDTCGRIPMAGLLADLMSGGNCVTPFHPIHGDGMIWDSTGWEVDPLARYSIGDMIANTFTQTGPEAGDNVLGFGSPLWSYVGCCGARSLAEMMEHLVHNADGYSSPLYYDWNSVGYMLDAIMDNIAAMKAQTDKLTFDGSSHLEVHTNA